MKRRFIKKQMDIAAQIYELMEQKGWTQKDLSEATGVYEQTLSNIMSGHANPTLKTLVKLEEAFEADVVVAPKFYKKTLKRNGFAITKKSLNETFELDLDFSSKKKSKETETEPHIYHIEDYQNSDEYVMSSQDLKSDEYQQAI